MLSFYLGLAPIQNEPGFDFNLIFWVLAFLLPVLARAGTFVFQLAAKLLGIELPQSPAKPGPGQPEKAAGEEPAAQDPNYPIFQELAPEQKPAAEQKRAPTPQPVRRSSSRSRESVHSGTSSRSTTRPRRDPRERTSLGPGLGKAPASSLTSSIAPSAPKALPSLRSEFEHTTETPTTLSSLASDPELVPPTTLGDWRRAIVLQEILAPPLALRRDPRPGEIHPFELG